MTPLTPVTKARSKRGQPLSYASFITPTAFGIAAAAKGLLGNADSHRQSRDIPPPPAVQVP
jgi:hypothetical protein